MQATPSDFGQPRDLEYRDLQPIASFMKYQLTMLVEGSKWEVECGFGPKNEVVTFTARFVEGLTSGE